MVKDTSVEQFLDELASGKPTPGGGGAAAFSGAMGAALISMVAHLTIGKKGYEAVSEEVNQILKKSVALRAKLVAAINDDVDVFNQVMSSYGMPRETAEEKEGRTAAIQAALKVATDVPLECAKLCREVIELSAPLAQKGNKNVISDVGVAVLAGYAGLKSAALNVYINIGAIKDEIFAHDRRNKIEVLLEGAKALQEDVYTLVQSKL